jgi:phage baseplate assembly protein V
MFSAFGLICDIKPDSGYVKVRIPELDNITTEFIPVLRRFAKDNSQSIPITVDDLCVVGRTVSGRWYVIGFAANDEDVPYSGASSSKYGVEFSDGCKIEYDIANKKLTVNTTGEIDVTAHTAKITGIDISLTGEVRVIGSLAVTEGFTLEGGDLSVNDGDVVAGDITLKSHRHGGVQTGSGVTLPPLDI